MYKRQTITQEVIDGLLDRIIELKKTLTTHTLGISEVIELSEKLTWLDDICDEDLLKIHDIITKIKDFISTMNRQVILLRKIKNQGIATNEIDLFRSEVDTLRETAQDLEAVFFFLPAMEEFNEANRILSLI